MNHGTTTRRFLSLTKLLLSVRYFVIRLCEDYVVLTYLFSARSVVILFNMDLSSCYVFLSMLMF